MAGVWRGSTGPCASADSSLFRWSRCFSARVCLCAVRDRQSCQLVFFSLAKHPFKKK